LEENRFPRIWMPTVEERDARQLVLHRHRLVQTRTRAKNGPGGIQASLF
jgi:transposase